MSAMIVHFGQALYTVYDITYIFWKGSLVRHALSCQGKLDATHKGLDGYRQTADNPDVALLGSVRRRLGANGHMFIPRVKVEMAIRREGGNF